MTGIAIIATVLQLFALISSAKGALCPIQEDTGLVYSMVNGVGPASLIWVQDLLWWWKSANPDLNYVGLDAADFQRCDLAAYPNLRVYLNPGGNAYDQLVAVGPAGADSIRRFVQRNQSQAPSAYVGICAGGYMAAHDFIWSSQYEGTDYYAFSTSPPFSLFPHTVEGSLIDISDDEHGDQEGRKYRMVNVSNGHTMLYYGGSTFGYNAVPDYADPQSPSFDPNIEVLLYYSDFYGLNSANIPAAWKYGRNILLTGPHPEADNCTLQDNGNDCPPPGTLEDATILQNRAWLVGYINAVAGTSWAAPEVPIAPVFDTSKPHADGAAGYPTRSCYDDSGQGAEGSVLFCNDFDSTGRVPEGLSPSFQRNQTLYNGAMPWNVTYESHWNGGVEYGPAHSGSGYAYCTPKNVFTTYPATITSVAVPVGACAAAKGSVSLSFAYKGRTMAAGLFAVDARVSSAFGEGVWTSLVHATLYPEVPDWVQAELPVEVTPSGQDGQTLQVRFSCASGSANPAYFCGVDSVYVRCSL